MYHSLLIHSSIKIMCFFCFCFFFQLHLWHMEVPRLGVESELQLPTYTTATAMPDRALTVNYMAALGNAGSLTHWARPGIKPATSWILVGFIRHWAMKEMPESCVLKDPQLDSGGGKLWNITSLVLILIQPATSKKTTTPKGLQH